MSNRKTLPVAQEVPVVASAILAVVFAFQAPAHSELGPAKRPPGEARAAKPESELRQRGRRLLTTAEGEAGGLAEPTMRGYALLQLARAYATLDRQKALDLLEQAVTAAGAVPDDSKAKPRLQQQILEGLAPLNPQRVDELLPQALPEVRTAAFQALLAYYQKNKQMDRAVEIIDRLAAEGGFPFAAANKLMEALPPENTEQRQRLFRSALESFRAEKPPEGYAGPGGDFGQTVTQQWRTLPPALVRQAIDELLRKAQSTESGSMEMTMFGGSGSLAFNSRYEWRLFQLLPILRQLDEATADELLKKNKSLDAQLQRYPQGMRSFEGDQQQPSVTGTVVTTRDSSGPRNSPPAPPPRVFRMLQQIEQMNRVLRDVKDHPQDALAQALLIADDGTRLRTLILVARNTQKSNTAVGKSALDAVVDQIARVELQEQVNILVDAGRLYLGIEEKDGVKKVVESGAATAEKMYKADINPDDPNKAPKAFWPSNNAWMNFVRLAAQVSPDAAVKMVNEIPDEEIRPTVRIALAAAWLDAPSGSNLIMTETKGGAHTLTGRGGEDEAKR